MRREEFAGKAVFAYIRDRIGVALCAAAAISVMLLGLWLQGSKLVGIPYAVTVSAFFLLLAGSLDFRRYYKRFRELELLKKCTWIDPELLPQAGTMQEKEYQEILTNLVEEKERQDSEMRTSHQEMLDFYSLWVHQIKTPIAGMRLLLQAQKETLAMEEEGFLEEASAQNNQTAMELFRVEQYVEMVLSYLRMEDMGTDLVLQNCRLDEIVRQSVRKLSKEFLYRKLHLELEPFEMTILSDEKWMALVLEQILSNALKYTPENGRIRIYPVSNKKVLVIEDTGIGIRSEDLPRVFEKGFTGYNGREDKRSTGIGLYLCKGVMDRLNHIIRIDSEEGKGTKVMLNFEREERVNE